MKSGAHQRSSMTKHMQLTAQWCQKINRSCCRRDEQWPSRYCGVDGWYGMPPDLHLIPLPSVHSYSPIVHPVLERLLHLYCSFAFGLFFRFSRRDGFVLCESQLPWFPVPSRSTDARARDSSASLPGMARRITAMRSSPAVSPTSLRRGKPVL